MKPTKPWSLASYAIGAAIFSGVLSEVFVARGFAVPVSPINLPITVAAIGLALALMAIPMARYRSALKDPKKVAKRLNPHYAFRVVALAKASSVAGALFFGWHVGILVVQLTLPAVSANVVYTILGVVAALMTTAIALVVEYLFRIPPDIEEPTEGSPA
jgi:Protein of unknown function (DUF3180)